MIDPTTQLAARDIDLIALAQRYGIELHKCSTNEVAGACPNPRCTSSKDGFHVNASLNRWRCYGCHSDRWYDAVELVEVCEGLRYPAAVALLLGDSAIKPVAKRVQAEKQPSSWDPARSAQTLQQAQERLWGTNALGELARAYLETRGLEAATWLNFRLGVGNVRTGNGNFVPAIALPWYRRGELVSINWRFLEAQNGQRYARWGSAVNRLFGNHANLDSADTLIVCEGELNACSISQVASHTRLHVLSTGKETAILSEPAVRAIATKYATIIVWADKREVTDSLQRQLAVSATGVVGSIRTITSEGDSSKQDANQLLQNGDLGTVLSIHREQLAQSSPDRLERLYADLLRGATTTTGLDIGTASVLDNVAKRLGKPVDLVQAGDNRWIVFADSLPAV